ncbi:MAG: hypothetical protein K2W97_04195 [Chthoniobacterales bacterium]|nr:hypothetical protein [Chthoniobacterales bacterium]
MKFFIPFLLAFTFALHATEEGSTTLPENPPMAINDDEASLTLNNDQETDPALKEKESRYVVISQKNSSPLMVFLNKENPEKKPLSADDLTQQQRRNFEPQDSSAAISRSPNPATISEKRNSTSPKPTLPEPSSLLFKTLSYCPGCKKWHTAANISKKQLPQILFMKKKETTFWDPVYRQDEQPASSLRQSALLQSMDPSPSRESIERKNFQFVTDDHGEQALHHLNPITGALEKSSFEDPINALPAISYCASILLQTRSLMPDTLAHFFLMRALEQNQNTLKTIPLVSENEKTPLLPRGIAPTTYSSTSTEN